MKKCRVCNWIKEEKDFYKGKTACKDCYNKQVEDYRTRNREKYLETKKRYNHSVEGKRSNAMGVFKYKEANPLKIKAHRIVRYAKQTHALVERPCEVCGSSDHIEAHHDNYEFPLDVRWLCRKHHKELHKELRKQA